MTDTVIKDLTRKCEDDVSEAIMRTAKLSPTQLGAATISLGAAAVALGVAAGAVAANCDEKPSPEEAADALWERLRPMVVRAFEAISALRRLRNRMTCRGTNAARTAAECTGAMPPTLSYPVSQRWGG